MSPNRKLLKKIKSRRNTQTQFGYGITTADRYVNTIEECMGLEQCYKFLSKGSISFNDVKTKAAQTLVYSNPQMTVDQELIYGAKEIEETNEVEFDSLSVELPKNTLMVFRNVLTTPSKDRDGDVLRTEGAEVDPNMLLLWQHVHTLPIGKMLVVAEHNSSKLSLITAIVDMNELSHDAAVMVDNQMGRFSHGFRALEFGELKEEDGTTTSPGGFDIKRFEIMEESLVSVPSNKDADTEEVLLSLIEGGKLTSDLMKSQGAFIREHRPISVPVTVDIKLLANGKEIRNENEPRSGETSPGSNGKGSEGNTGTPKEAGIDQTETETDADNTQGLTHRAVGTTGETDDHSHTATVDDDGDGRTNEVEGHVHEIEAFEIQEADEHTHSLDQDGLRSAPGEVKFYNGQLEGSWEEIENQLRSASKSYLTSMSVAVGEHDWTYLAGTYSDHAVIVLEKPEMGVTDEFRYYKTAWETTDGKAVFKGEPQQVDIVTTTEIQERSALYNSKLPAEEKAGRVLSARNLQALMDVKADIEELSDKETDLTRGGKAICERCVTKLSQVIEAASPREEENEFNETDLKSAMEIVLAKAGPAERKLLIDFFEKFNEIEEGYQVSEAYRAFTGSA